MTCDLINQRLHRTAISLETKKINQIIMNQSTYHRTAKKLGTDLQIEKKRSHCHTEIIWATLQRNSNHAAGE